MRAHAAEILSVLVIAGLYAASLVLAQATGRIVAWSEWSGMYVIGGVIGLLGLFYRVSRRSEALALTLLATAIMIFFAHAGGIFNHLLFPLSRPLIDASLFVWDARLGYDWVAFVELVARWPLFGRGLGYVYDSSLVQLLLVVLVLGLGEQAVALHRFLLVGVLGSLATISIWWLAPSFGPAAHMPIDAELAQRIELRVNAHYVAALHRLAADGLDVVRPGSILGVVAFPSFHTVMACMAVWFSWGTRIFWPMALLNTAMIPAILSHGGHHLVDVFAGVALFFVVWWLATLIVPTRTPVVAAAPLAAPVPAGLRGS